MNQHQKNGQAAKKGSSHGVATAIRSEGARGLVDDPKASILVKEVAGSIVNMGPVNKFTQYNGNSPKNSYNARFDGRGSGPIQTNSFGSGFMKTYDVHGSRMPAIGLGTWKMDDGAATQAVVNAIRCGYRHIDCAAIYLNESDIGLAFESAFQQGIVAREALWVTSKLWCNRHKPELVMSALKQTLSDLKLDYLDLYMIHWPIVFRHDLVRPESGADFVPLSEVPLPATWQALEECVDAGLCKHLGVCNFNTENLDLIRTNAKHSPAVNQVECQPYLPQTKLRAYCAQHDIRLVAYSPLGSGDRPERMRADSDPNLFDDPTIQSIASQRGCTIGQVILAWLVQSDLVAIPKSTHPGRMKENLDSMNMELTADDMVLMDSLNPRHRFVHGKFWEMPGSPYTAAGIWGND